MKEYGMLITCDRCHASTFSKANGEDELDGGWTVVKKTTPIPDGWSSCTKVGDRYVDLCPECAKEFSRLCCNYLSDCFAFMRGDSKK